MKHVILAAVDLSPITTKTVRAAATLARDCGAQLVLLNVTTPATILRDHRAFARVVARVPQLTRAHPSSAMPSGGENVAAVHGDTLQLVGEPVDVIIEQARKLGAELIVLGSHRHSALHDLALGSTAAAVLHAAECPVMVVSPRERSLLARWKDTASRRRRSSVSRRGKAGIRGSRSVVVAAPA